MFCLKKPLRYILLFNIGIMTCSSVNSPPASFDLTDWKLQIPGSKEITNLAHYSSAYFYLDTDKALHFNLDAAEKGHTKNSEYLRCELRHLNNWQITEKHEIEGEIKVVSAAVPAKVTVLQIHGIAADGGDAPPLLRIALNSGDLYAFLKTSGLVEDTDSILLAKNIKEEYFRIQVKVQNGILYVFVNTEKKMEKNIGYWQYKNYFKIGCYPQAKQGKITVIYRNLAVY
jgi:hypothetical protein